MLDVGETDWVEEVPSAVTSDEQVALEPEYHWYAYGAVPPDGLTVKVIDWPVSTAGAEGMIAPAVNAVLTVTVIVSPAEHCETGKKAESVTL